MDLKSIINIDSSTNTGQPQAPPRPSPPVATSPHTHHRPSPGTYASPNIYHHTYDSRPPQPVPPYQHQLSPQNDLRSSVIPPYEAVHLSPQLQKHASLPGNQYPFPQRASPSPIQNQQAHPYQRDAYQSTMAVGGAPRPHSNSFSRPTPSPYPPLTTPSNSLGQVQSHTSPSPSISSAHAITPHSLRESPMSASSLSHQNHFQSMTQHSQPGTPLGPPAHYQRTSTFSTMEPPSPYGQTKSQSGASYGPPAGTPGNNASRIASSPGGYEGHGQANDREAIEREYYRERERTVSVSPKTKVPSRQQSAETRHSSQDIWNQAVTPSQVHQNANGVNFHGYETHSPKMTAGGSSRQSSVEVKSSGHDLWNTQVAQTNNQTMVQQDVNGLQSFRSPHPHTHAYPKPMAPLASSSPTTVVASTKLPSTNNAVTHPLPSKPAPVISNNSAAASIQPHVSAPESSTNPSPSPATLNPNIRKRKRNDPVPIWAQKRANPRPINRQAPVNIPLPLPPQQPIQHTKTPNGQQKPQVTEPKPNPFIKKPEPKTAVKKIELWEPSITGIKPYDQLTRQVCDFLCEHVAWNDLATLDPNVGQLEVEAKLGKLFDKQTQQLFEMDIGNEAILHPEQNRYIRFESSMSLEQHKQLNFSLNRAHDESRRRDPTREVPRIPLVYRHTRETDSFFESTPAMIATLPPQVQQVIYAHSRQQPRIRVTRGEKGEVLAKIIKVRLMDRHIWNPHSDHISYRISISLEVKYHGDIAGLVEVRENGLLNTRYKDRMTYNHQNYQIDLTQVTKTDHPSTTPRTHELEIEVDVLELVKQGRLLKTNPNESKFERMVEGFVDNMRILGRSVGSQG